MSEDINLRPKGARRFRLYFDNKKVYYTVYIFKTKDQMTDWCNKIVKTFTGENVDTNFGALTHPWSVKDKEGEWINDIGFIAFCEPYLFNYVIAHELAHATCEWFFRDNRPQSLDGKRSVKQEVFAWQLGEAFKQMMIKLKRER